MMDFGVYHPANHDGWHGDGGRLDMHCTGAARRQFPATPMAGGGACGGAAAEEEGRRDEAMARLQNVGGKKIEETLQNLSPAEQLKQIDICAVGPMRVTAALHGAGLNGLLRFRKTYGKKEDKH